MEIADISLDKNLSATTQKIFDERKHKLCVRTDKLFVALLWFEWVAGILSALVISPLAWSGSTSSLHIHVIFAAVFGCALALLPMSLVATRPGEPITRYVIAASQMLFSAMFVHLSGGRIETHFHVFGSLAFLAFYRDWRVLVVASAVTGMDHLVRSVIWPASIFGVGYASPWRAFEHIGWVIFEDIFLIKGTNNTVREMFENAAQTAMLEQTNEIIERAVTEQTKTIREGELEVHRLAAIVQQSDDSIVSMSMDGTMRSWNDGATRLFQYTAEEMIGQMYNPPIPDAVKNEQRELLRKIKHGQTVINYETVAYRKDGTLVDISLTMSPVRGANDELVAFACVARDITQKKIADRRISEFYSVISHELRTPLTSIRGALALIADGIVEQGTPEASELIGIAQNSTSRLVRLINDILDLRKIEAGKFELNLCDIDVRDLVETSVSGMMGFADEKKVKLNATLTEDFQVEADMDRINQVLSNLISNAVKYAPEGSTVEIEAIKCSHSMRFEVSDCGPGIPLEFHSKLFGKFQQVDASDTRAKEGSGLGLAISKAIVEQHGGSISFTSEPGVKTTFQFEIPLANKYIFATDDDVVLADSIESQTETYQDARPVKPLRLVSAANHSNTIDELRSNQSETETSQEHESLATSAEAQAPLLNSKAACSSSSPSKSSSVSDESSCSTTPISTPAQVLSAAARAAGQSFHGFVSAVSGAAVNSSSQCTPVSAFEDSSGAAIAKKHKRARRLLTTESEGVASHFFPAFTHAEMSLPTRAWPTGMGDLNYVEAEHSKSVPQASSVSNRVRKILIVEDDVELSALLRINLMRQNYVCFTAQTLEEARHIIAHDIPDAVVLDLELPDGDGLDLIERLPSANGLKGRTPVIVITGSDRSAKKEESSIVDWLHKPFNQGNLSDAVRKAVTTEDLRKKVMVIDDDPMTKLAVTAQLSQLEVNFVDADDCPDIGRFDEGPQLDLIVFKESCLQSSEATRAFRKLRGQWSDYVPIIIYSSSELHGRSQSTSSVSISHHVPKPSLEAKFLSKVEGVLFNFLSQSKSISRIDTEPAGALKALRDVRKIEEL